MGGQEAGVLGFMLWGCDVDRHEFFGGGSATVSLPELDAAFTVPGLSEEELELPFEELDAPYVYLEHLEERTFSWLLFEHDDLEGFEPCGRSFSYAFLWMNYGSFRDLAEVTLIFDDGTAPVSDLGEAESLGMRTADDWYGGPKMRGDGTEGAVSLPVIVDCPEGEVETTMEIEWQLDPEVYHKEVHRTAIDIFPPYY
jgi:hypothetical protein